MPGAEAVFAGASISGRQFQELTKRVVAVWLEHDDAIGSLRQAGHDVWARLLDVMEDTQQERSVILRQGSVVDRRDVDRTKLHVRASIGLGAVDRRVRLVQPVNGAKACRQCGVGK